MSPIDPTRIPPLKRQYPHVDDISDWRAQQSIRLLWDRIFDLDGRLQAAEGTQGDLVNAVNAQEDQLDEVTLTAGEALAIAQTTRTEQEEAEGGETGGESTIPDYESIVVSTLAEFVSPIVPEGQDTAAKAQLTRRAAWNIYQVDPNIRLLKVKPPHSNVNGRSADVIVQGTDGSFADCASETDNGDGTYTIHAQWNRKAPDRNTSDESRWIVPTAAIANEPGPMTVI